MGAPAGYAILNYAGAPNNTLPTTPAPQPGSVAAWTLDQINGVSSCQLHAAQLCCFSLPFACRIVTYLNAARVQG